MQDRLEHRHQASKLSVLIIKWVSIPATAAWLFTGCFQHDSMQRYFVIKSLQVNGIDITIAPDQSEVIIPTSSGKLVLQPVWIADGRDVSIVFRLEKGSDLDLVYFRIDAQYLRDLVLDHPNPNEPPCYYQSRHGEIQILKLPVHIDSVIRIGLMSDRVDADKDQYIFYARISSPSLIKEIRIVGFRKI